MGTEETFPFSPRHFGVQGRAQVFALTPLGAEQLTVGLKCDPVAEQLRQAHPAITDGYHLNKRH